MSFVNLLPEDYIARQTQKRANLMCSVLFAAVMTGVLTAAVVSDQKHKRTLEVSGRVNQSYNDAGRLIEQMQKLDVTKHEMLKKAKLTADLLERVPRSYLLAVVANALPKGASLLEFKLATKRSKKLSSSGKSKSRYKTASAKRKGKSASKAPENLEVMITITGLAGTDLEVAQFITAMSHCSLMESVDLIYSQEEEIDEIVAREFQVILRLKSDADVVGGAATSAKETDADRGDKRLSELPERTGSAKEAS